MAETINRGPTMSLGPMVGNVKTQAGSQVALVEPTDGPGSFYQWLGFPDIRESIGLKDSMKLARMANFFAGSSVQLLDAIPSASSASPADISAAALAVALQPLVLVSAQPSVGSSGQCAHMPNVPVYINGTNTLATGLSGTGTTTGVFGLDMGFGFGTTVAGSGTVTVTDSSIFTAGQFIVIGGAGNSGTTVPLICQVTNPALSGTTISVSPVALGAVTRAPISSGNAQIGFPANVPCTATRPYSSAGVARMFNPLEGVTRAVGIVGLSGSSASAFLVKGYDIFGFAMSELISHPGGASVQYGQKAFKYIASITPQAGVDTTHNWSAGVADQFGFNIRADKWEYVTSFFNATLITAASATAGFQAALAPVSGPSTTTSIDVRGTISIGTRNKAGAGGGGAPTDGAKRLTLAMSVPLFNMVNGTPNNSVPMFGLPQI